jgi:hypothetical protein
MAHIIVPSRRVWTQQPQGSVEIERSHPALMYGRPLMSYLPTADVDLSDMSGLITNVGPAPRDGAASGLAHRFNNSARRLSFVRNASPKVPAATLIASITVDSLSQFNRIVQTSSQTAQAGLWCNVTTAGAIDLSIGSANGTGPEHRRSLGSPNSVIGIRPAVVVAVMQTSTTGFFYVDGKRYAATATGTASTYNAGTGAATVGALYTSGAWYYSQMRTSHVTLLDGAIPEYLARELSENPWRIFRPRKRITFFDLGAGGAISLAIAKATHSHSTDTPSLSADTLLALADAQHTHLADQLTLDVSTAVALEIADTAHAQVADGLTLLVAAVLAVANAAHGHAAEAPTLSWEALLAVADAAHGHAADSLALSTAVYLAIAGAVHAHAAESIELDTSNATWLTTQDAGHAHIAASPGLTLDAWLAVVDAWHAHAADSISLSAEQSLVIAEALHAHFADALALTLPSDIVFTRAPDGAGPSIIVSASTRPGHAAGARPGQQPTRRPAHVGSTRH